MVAKLLAAVALLFSAGTASASLTPTLAGPPTAIGGGQFAWTYDVLLNSDQRLATGSYFTLYDFNGLTGSLSSPAGWTFSSALTGVTPPLTNPGDDVAVFNATYTYAGPTIIPAPATSINLGQFTLTSTFSLLSQDFFTSHSIRNSGPQVGTTVDTIGFVTVPGIPEPQNWVMLIAGFGLVGGAARRRKVRNVPA